MRLRIDCSIDYLIRNPRKKKTLHSSKESSSFLELPFILLFRSRKLSQNGNRVKERVFYYLLRIWFSTHHFLSLIPSFPCRILSSQQFYGEILIKMETMKGRRQKLNFRFRMRRLGLVFDPFSQLSFKNSIRLEKDHMNPAHCFNSPLI